MNYGLYLSASGALTNLHKQDVHANNLANSETVGFKPDTVFTSQRLPERLESPGGFIDPQHLLEKLGGGQALKPTHTVFTQGKLSATSNPLDTAIKGDGFFVVASGAGTGAENIRLTRDGRFTLNDAGELMMSATGMRVLDVNDEPIQLDPLQRAHIQRDGTIEQDGRVVAQLQIAEPTDESLIRKAGDNVFRFKEGEPPNRTAAGGIVLQEHVEGSAVDPILTMNAMIGASKSAQSNATLMQYHDHVMGQAINTFGHVA